VRARVILTMTLVGFAVGIALTIMTVPGPPCGTENRMCVLQHVHGAQLAKLAATTALGYFVGWALTGRLRHAVPRQPRPHRIDGLEPLDPRNVLAFVRARPRPPRQDRSKTTVYGPRT
jgi:hypothetical protein